MYYYSASTGHFYVSSLHGSSIPADAKPVPNSRHAELMAGQSTGLRIVPNADGDPELAPQPVPPYADLKAEELAAFRVLREGYLNRLAGIGVAFMIAGDTEGAEAAATMRQGLLDLPARPAVEAAQNVEDLRNAMQSEYATLVAAVPVRLREQFKKVDA